MAVSASAAFAVAPAHAATATFYRSPGCGCCHVWGEKMKAVGFDLEMIDTEDLAAEQAKLGVPEAIQGCHAGIIDGYAISGHVPPEDIKRLLTERPEAKGLTVAGMPAGSPGMEGAGSEPYASLLFQADGSYVEYAKHG
ncbi:MAG: DUF411 domain-containing protein [Aestuariivirga sp.]